MPSFACCPCGCGCCCCCCCCCCGRAGRGSKGADEGKKGCTNALVVEGGREGGRGEGRVGRGGELARGRFVYRRGEAEEKEEEEEEGKEEDKEEEDEEDEEENEDKREEQEAREGGREGGSGKEVERGKAKEEETPP